VRQREAVDELQQRHRARIAECERGFLVFQSRLSRAIEHALRYRAAAWDLHAPTAPDQVTHLADLIAFTYARLPFPEQEPGLCSAKSLETSKQRCEAARMRLETLRMETETKSRKLGEVLDGVQAKTAEVQQRIAKMQRRYDAGCELLREQEEQMKVMLEQRFRRILERRSAGAQRVRQNAMVRYRGAKGSLRKLKEVQLDFLELNNPLLRYPTLALEAKLRVSKIILGNLRSENEKLRRGVEELRHVQSAA
jgi:hypothetical protein